jgi:6-phosphogluconolactonase
MAELLRPDPLALAEALADEVATLLSAAVNERGRASLVVSGGETPKPFLVALSCRAVPWERVFVTLADERWVPPRDPASNERLVRENLLEGPAARAKFVGLKTTEPEPEDAEGDVEARLAVVPRPFDVVVLGVGSDGHTASLFPGAVNLDAALDPRRIATCTTIHPPAAAHPRMTLTLHALASARRVYIHCTGAEKRAVLERARSPSADPRRTPVTAVLRTLGERATVAWAP